MFKLLDDLYLLLWLFLENVKTIGDKNKKRVMEELNRRGFLMLTPQLTASDYGAASKRVRQWFLCVQVGVEKANQMVAKYKEPKWAKDCMAVLLAMRIGSGEIDDILIPEGHHDIKDNYKTMVEERIALDVRNRKSQEAALKKESKALAEGQAAQPRIKKHRGPGSEEKWRTDHYLMFKDAGETDYPPDLNKYNSEFCTKNYCASALPKK